MFQIALKNLIKHVNIPQAQFIYFQTREHTGFSLIAYSSNKTVALFEFRLSPENIYKQSHKSGNKFSRHI